MHDGKTTVTLRDIARRTGISLGTVSRFINGETVRESTREKLEAAILDLGYKENIVTRAKRTGNSMTIAVVVSQLNAEFFMDIIQSMDNFLRDQMYSILLCNFQHDSHILKKRLEELRYRSIDGIVLFPSGLEGDVVSELKAFLNEGTPVVVIDDKVHGLKTDSISTDNFNATYGATEYLIRKGHRRIGFLAGRKTSFVAMDRYRGCKAAFETYDIPWDDDLVRWADFEVGKSSTLFNELVSMPDPPTAVFPMSYDMTLGVLLSTVNRHIQIPGDLSVFGFDLFSGVEALSTKLTLMKQPTAKMGQVAAETLLERIQGHWDSFPLNVELKAKMIVHDSISAIGS
ncbi:LacI family transcriptional regulator [Oceanispirochaeta crateris]|uniref:LacI family transcriptional regulator n=1 Tax=Oceanispirochaeta crateris TaxID=2518645 RepID=A0A5C1QQ11_9SPIO|nr:LacI family DNA-binding transcriptional regulator [Oceanispirochaeta crateris]QEN09448.1 LacI family transcriptional regulator [Oceanispirochaeta crateris]